ncbi:MAG: hypothetical protein R3F34_08365 [Planctomycetota bacterium]
MPVRLRPFLVAAAIAIAASCRGTDAADTAGPAGAERRGGAADEGAGGDAAPAPVDELEEHVRAARELFAQGDPASALSEVDRALELAPDRPDLLVARADGLVVLGDDLIRQGANGLYITSSFEDALRAYDRCDETVRTLMGRSRALARLGRGTEAFDAAERAGAVAAELEAKGERVPTSPLGSRDEISAQAVYLAYAESVTDTTGASFAVDDLPFSEVEGRVMEWVATARDDVDAWNTLANLYLYRSSATNDVADTRRALETIEVALQHLPDDAALLQRLVTTANTVGGPEEVERVTERFVRRYPDSAGGRFQGAKARFDLALANFPGPDATEAERSVARNRFEDADQWFGMAYELEPDGAGADAQGWQAVSRIARGWVDYFAGNLAGAETWFLATDELFPRAIEWSIDGSLRSGLDGLFSVSAAYASQGDLEDAARLADELLRRDPENGDYANNAGFLHRDRGVELEIASRAARARGDAGEADRLLEKAWEHVRASADAYRLAAELLPDDVRVQNDFALILVYYLHEDLDLAQSTLLRAVDLAQQQLADDDLDESARFDLLNAYGDALENLGVLFLEHRDDPATAAEWFRKAVDVGPMPRPIVTRAWLPRIEGTLPADEEPYTILDWGRPGE